MRSSAMQSQYKWSEDPSVLLIWQSSATERMYIKHTTETIYKSPSHIAQGPWVHLTTWRHLNGIAGAQSQGSIGGLLLWVPIEGRTRLYYTPHLMVHRIRIIDRNRKVLCFGPDWTWFKSADPMVEYSGVNKVQSHPNFDRQSQLFWTRPDRTLLRWRTRLVYEPAFIIANRIRFRIAIGTSVVCTCLLVAIAMWSPPSMARIVFVLSFNIVFICNV